MREYEMCLNILAVNYVLFVNVVSLICPVYGCLVCSMKLQLWMIGMTLDRLIFSFLFFIQ